MSAFVLEKIIHWEYLLTVALNRFWITWSCFPRATSSANAISFTALGICNFSGPWYKIFHRRGPTTDSWGIPPVMLNSLELPLPSVCSWQLKFQYASTTWSFHVPYVLRSGYIWRQWMSCLKVFGVLFDCVVLQWRNVLEAQTINSVHVRRTLFYPNDQFHRHE